jgi:hypothetical protein
MLELVRHTEERAQNMGREGNLSTLAGAGSVVRAAQKPRSFGVSRVKKASTLHCLSAFQFFIKLAPEPRAPPAFMISKPK